MTKKQRLISGFVDIAQGIAKILTLGHVNIHWNYKYSKSTLK